MMWNNFDIRCPMIDTQAKEVMVANPCFAMLSVSTTSAIAHRKAVYKMAQYFGAERNSMTLYGWDGREDDINSTAYLWVYKDWLVNGKVPCVGACCFRQREEGGPALQWIWLHPFVRRKGILSGSWSLFEKNHPNFAAERPLSESMLRFLEKRGHKDGICGWYLDLPRHNL